MGRYLMIAGLGMLLLLLACEESLHMDPYATDQVYQGMHVDFSIDILDSASGTVRLVDHSTGVERLEWSGVVKSHWINIPASYPGDTLVLDLSWPGTYVIQLVGSAYGRQRDGDEPALLKVTRVKRFELMSTPTTSTLKPYLLYLKLDQFPALDEHALPWDVDFSGPDVGINISYTYDDEYVFRPLLEDTLHNLQKNQLPIVRKIELPFSILDHQISLEMIDIDSRRENKYLAERMAWENFTIDRLDEPAEADTLEYAQKYLTIGVVWK